MSEDSQDTIITDVEDGTQQIQSGEVEDTSSDEGLVAKTSPTQREQAMQRILENRKAEQAGDVEDEEPPQKAVPPVVNPDVFRLKVDGHEVEVPREKVIDSGIRALQKESTADKRLAEASARETQLNARAAELARMEAELLAKREQPVSMEPDETGRKFAEALFTDENEVAKTITNITRKLADVESKVERVHQAEEGKKQQAFGDAVHHYHTAHEAIATDPDMHLVFNNNLKRIAAENPGLSPTQVVDRAAEHIYTKFGVQRAGEKQIDPEPRGNERQRAKQNMPAPIKRASARVPTPAPPKQKTPADVLDEMRKTRGPRPY
jgi:hypothetical protein